MAVLIAAAACCLFGCKGDDGARLVATIDLSGGDALGEAGVGGRGGEIEIAIEESAEGDPGVSIRSGGRVDVSYERARVDSTLGSNPLVVSDHVLVVMASGIDPSAGTVYMERGNNRLFFSDGNGEPGDEEPITGVEILPGGTLELSHHVLNEGEVIQLAFAASFVNDGVLTTLDTVSAPDERARVELFVLSYVGAGQILNGGIHPGQRGGEISIFANLFVVNDGDWDVSGGPGADGGLIDVRGDTDDDLDRMFIENTGRIDARGGDDPAVDPTAFGGDGGRVFIISEVGTFNTGEIDASAGDGHAGGGEGGSASVGSLQRGDVVNRGRMRADGGDATAGDAGDAGNVFVASYGGELRSRASLFVRGGRSEEGRGGSGGTITFGSLDEPLPPAVPGEQQPAGPISVSGRLIAHGGDGLTEGGAGGSLISGIGGLTPEGDGARSVKILGQSSVRLSGGDGAARGGDARQLLVDGDVGEAFVRLPVEIAVPVALRGGDADAAGTGGDGGDALLRGVWVDFERIDVDGGAGLDVGDDGSVTVESAGPPPPRPKR